jgi:hypothetical protein
MQYIGHPVVGDLLYGYNQPHIPPHETSVFIPPKKITIDQLVRDSVEKTKISEYKNFEESLNSDSMDSFVDPPVTARYQINAESSSIDYSKPVPLLLHSYSLRFRGLHNEEFFFKCLPPKCFFDFIRDHSIDFDLSQL